MAPLHRLKRSSQKSTPSSNSHPNSSHNPRVNGAVSSSGNALSGRRSGKRKLTGNQPVSSTSSGLLNGSSSQAVAAPFSSNGQAQDAGTVFHFRAQSTSNFNIEVDAVSTSSDKNDYRHPNKHLGNMSQGEIVLLLTEDETRMVKSTAFVINMPEEIVKKQMLILKRKGKRVTREALLDECTKNTIQEPSRPGKTGENGSSSSGAALRGASAIAAQLQSTAISMGNQPSNTIPRHGFPSLIQKNGLNNTEEDQVDGTTIPGDIHSNQESNGGKITNASSSNSQLNDSPAVNQVFSGPKNIVTKSNGPSSEANAISMENQRSSTAPRPAFPSLIQRNGLDNTEEDQVDCATLIPGDVISNQEANGSMIANASGSNSHHNDSPVLNQVSSGAKDIATKSSGPSSKANAVALENTNASPQTRNDTDEELKGQDSTDSTHQSPKNVDSNQHLATCVKLLRKENKLLDIARHCGECKNRTRDVTFLPCGHMWACRSCAGPLYICPCCNKSILATVNTYLC
ncbi:baculoviral iap repeat-containing protein 2-like [Plakobranchus ocellatus]|uniref:Baculoviral iap repeat-containing protein 2-like n=1 Tax=Plakobranchus ocellatus TaxID=259542 RepID=A0AAV4BFS8_9GAST|nr:baculoviral iap repeat-containing protein 2-like [Plakobranchus ocellatus]